jgi:hypothetical protein
VDFITTAFGFEFAVHTTSDVCGALVVLRGKLQAIAGSCSCRALQRIIR